MKKGVTGAVVVLSLLTCQAQISNSLSHWIWRNPLPQGDTLTGVAFGQGTYAAVGNGGVILTSTNRSDWILSHSVGTNLEAVIFADGRFVVGVFIATTWGSASVSTDGLNWAFDSSLPPAQIIYTNGLFLAPFQNSILVSTNAQNWITNNVLMDSTLSRIATDGNGAVGVGVGGVIVASSNLHDWHPIGSGDRAVAHLIVYGAGRFVAARGGASMITSTDGRTWNDSTNLAGAGSIFDLLFAEDRFWSVARGPATNGSISTQVFSSNDGVQWHQLFRTNDFPLHYFAYGAGQAVAVGGHDHPNPGYPDVATSSNLSNWHCQRLTNWGNGAIFDVAFGNGGFVAVGWKRHRPEHYSGYEYYGLIASSTDGTNWSGNWNPLRQPLGTVAYGNGIFVAPEPSAYFHVSTNGMNWERVVPTGLQCARQVIFARGSFIALAPGYSSYCAGTQRLASPATASTGPFTPSPPTLTRAALPPDHAAFSSLD